jgi:hypothetical protein
MDAKLERELGLRLELSAKTVGPEARRRLMPLLKYYAKKPHPFTSCFRDNKKRFGPHGAAQVCATLKDIIRGTTKWRKGAKFDHGSAGLSETDGAMLALGVVDHDMPLIDDETFALIEQLTDEDLREIVYGEG